VTGSMKLLQMAKNTSESFPVDLSVVLPIDMLKAREFVNYSI
jgi:hypothetical protein